MGDSESGIALVITLMITLLMSTIAVALIMTTTVETRIASHFQRAQAGLYAAEAVVERSLDDLLRVANWNRLLDGSAQSSFVDGPPNGTRTLTDGSTIDLAATLNLANCRKTGACTAADMDAVSDDRPWGPNNPRWNLFAYGRLSDLLAQNVVESPFYGVVMIGDDPGETDGDPTLDAPWGHPGSGILALRGEAFGPGGAHKVVEMTVTRAQPEIAITVLSWREVR
ncbi:MAG TPA: pilus assembly PilX N-terminal domain-containing protein [Vicinamibacterales bacterium]|nr:pilus assembly PilX N-terminal domain-containing protein [Vicinamibacterales bacterium]